MNLAKALDETNEVLRDLATKLEPAEPEPELPPPTPVPRIGADPVPFSRTAPLAAMLALRALLKPVPAEYGRVRRRNRAHVACVCRRAHRFDAAGFHECSCGRMFAFTGKRLLVIPLDD